MLHECRALAEALGAVRARVGLLARVDALVRHQVRVLREALAAFAAAVRPLARVRGLESNPGSSLQTEEEAGLP